GHTPSFVFVGRMLKDKGVREFMEAASLVKKRFPEARFRMIGGIDKNPAAVSQEEIEAGADAGDIEWVGHVEDVRPFMGGFSVFVLPSYREGVPRSTLEAMALGKAIVTTDAPGCRETVIDGVNGFLVPPRNGTHLADVLMRFCEDISLAERFGAESRKM